jgi:hypothetical protein
MKPLILVAAALCMGLAGCQKVDETPAGRFGGGAHKGRYFGLGIYGAGRMWAQLERPADPKAPPNPAAATLQDDEVVLVMMDSATGEVRQCGNLSGYCVRSDPWAVEAPAAPAALAKHAEQLDAEAGAAVAIHPTVKLRPARRSSSRPG